MKILVLLSFIMLSFSFNSPKEKKYLHSITNDEKTLTEMSSETEYTVFYSWADWCGPCILAMKTRLLKTKRVTDSLKIPIKYNSILYALIIKDKSRVLMQNAYDNGIEVYHKASPNALTQKLAINSDFKHYKGFQKEFMVPRVLLVNKEGELLSNFFPLDYGKGQLLEKLKVIFPSYFEQ